MHTLLICNAILITADILIRLFERRGGLSRFEIKGLVKEALAEYGVQKSQVGLTLDAIAAARARSQAVSNQDYGVR
jgi:hypothetical protein